MSSAKIALIFKLRMLGLSLSDERLAMAAAAVAAAAVVAAPSMRHSAAMEAATQAGMPAPCVSVRDAAAAEDAECTRLRLPQSLALPLTPWPTRSRHPQHP